MRVHFQVIKPPPSDFEMPPQDLELERNLVIELIERYTGAHQRLRSNALNFDVLALCSCLLRSPEGKRWHFHSPGRFHTTRHTRIGRFLVNNFPEDHRLWDYVKLTR